MKLSFSRSEKKAVAGLSSVIALRMLGLSMLIPVFSVYAISLPGATPFLAGLAFGIYGLTQALLQIPFGYYSDKIGRKPVVATGLLIFGIGSVMAAMTDNIYLLIAARFLQGAGAIASACFAWIADLTDPSRRNTAMAFMGISVGGGVVSGMIVGPVLGAAFGVPDLFWIAAILSGIAIYITVARLEEPAKKSDESEEFTSHPVKSISYAMTSDLIRLDITGFLVNCSMISVFFIIPLRLKSTFEMGELWKLYLPFAFFGSMAMMFSSRRADKGGAEKIVAGATFFAGVSFAVFAFFDSVSYTVAGFGLFFAAFSVLEATLPAAVSKLADPRHKGTVIGVFNLSQFSGTFVGGLLAGLYAADGGGMLFGALAIMAVIIAVMLLGLKGLSPQESEAPAPAAD